MPDMSGLLGVATRQINERGLKSAWGDTSKCSKIKDVQVTESLGTLMKTKSNTGLNGLQKPTVARIVRAVASSTAIETGQSIKELEARLIAQDSKFQQLPLASS